MSSKLFIVEHKDTPRSDSGHVMQIAGDYGVNQTPLDFSGGVQTSSAFKATTRYVWLSTTASCSIEFGTNPTATINSRFIGASFCGYFPAFGGDKVSVIANS